MAASGAASGTGQFTGSEALTPDSWQMLKRGNHTVCNQLATLCGHPLRTVANFLPPDSTATTAAYTRENWILPVHRLVLAMIWLITAWLSAGLTPLEESLALLASLGLQGQTALLALYSAVALDTAFGIATLLRPGPRLWLLQAGLIVFYNIVIAVYLPAFWLHPFGPLLKNLAVLSLLLHLYSERTS